MPHRGFMHCQDLAIVKGLVSVAWADGRVTSEEHAVIDALLEAFKASPSERREILDFAAAPRTIEDIPIHELSYDDRRVLLLHAGFIAWIDGEQHERERELLTKLSARLRIPAGEAKMLLDEAELRAKGLRDGL